jgi:hypothetical protein
MAPDKVSQIFLRKVCSFFVKKNRQVFQCPQKTGSRAVSARARVTRFGEISPIGRLFTFSSFLKLTEVAQIFGLLFFHDTRYVCTYILILPINGLGFVLGDSFTNSSGHPGQGWQIFLVTTYPNGKNKPNNNKMYQLALIKYILNGHKTTKRS